MGGAPLATVGGIDLVRKKNLKILLFLSCKKNVFKKNFENFFYSVSLHFTRFCYILLGFATCILGFTKCPKVAFLQLGIWLFHGFLLWAHGPSLVFRHGVCELNVDIPRKRIEQLVV